jgi:hypothetical protein
MLPPTTLVVLSGTPIRDLNLRILQPSFNPLALDWTATLTDTSSLDLNGTISSPEPSTLFLVPGGAARLRRSPA